MNRGDKTTVDELKAGDRFYKVADKLKTSYQIISGVETCESEYIKNGAAPLYRLRKMKGSTIVVFLRNVNQTNETHEK